MKIGEIYLWDTTKPGSDSGSQSLLKVIQFDDYEVHADSVRLEEVYSGWRMENKKLKNEIFTRTRKEIFLKKFEYCSFEPLEQEFIDYYHLTLPMRICRFRDISWGDELFYSSENINAYLQQCQIPQQINRTLSCKEIYLEGTNKNWRTQKPILVTADNGEYFTVSELMFKANEIQRAIKSNKNFKTDGIGIYRTGMFKGLPCYYIWGYHDLANFLKEYEDDGVDITNA